MKKKIVGIFVIMLMISSAMTTILFLPGFNTPELCSGRF
jgi:hypothetical protein